MAENTPSSKTLNIYSHVASNVFSKEMNNNLSNLSNCEITFTVQNSQYENISVTLYPWSYVRDIEHELEKYPFYSSIVNKRIFYNNKELRYDRTLSEYQIEDGSKLVISNYSNKQCNSAKIYPFGTQIYNHEYDTLFKTASLGISMGIKPKLLYEGTSGTYILKNKNKGQCAIFKPRDEEAFSPNNPQGYTNSMGSESFTKGILSGQGAIREVAAYLLDKNHFSKVPKAMMVEIIGGQGFNYNIFTDKSCGKMRTKIGSLSELVSYDDYCCNYGSSRFSTEQIHKIALLDIRIMNMDRNESNILVKIEDNKNLSLIPIDHGSSLPCTLDLELLQWVWLEWDQINIPFSHESLKYINNIDINADIKLLRSLQISEDAINVFKVMNLFLKKGAQFGFTLGQIANMIISSKKNCPSGIEILCNQAFTLSMINSNVTFIKRSKKETKHNDELKKNHKGNNGVIIYMNTYKKIDNVKQNTRSVSCSNLRETPSVKLIVKYTMYYRKFWNSMNSIDHLMNEKSNIKIKNISNKFVTKNFFRYIRSLTDFLMGHISMKLRKKRPFIKGSIYTSSDSLDNLMSIHRNSQNNSLYDDVLFSL